MINKTITYLVLALVVHSGLAQNENTKWIFGFYSGLDFMSNPPSTITHTTLAIHEGVASVADANGNLLFYTDGYQLWNGMKLPMANGGGLLGDYTTVQSSLIIKQPGNSNVFFLFTLQASGGPAGLRYSTIDMNLAAGLGSVTAKNIPIVAPCTEQLTGTTHYNQIDSWILTHAANSNSFLAYQVTAAGVNTVPVVSATGSIIPHNSPYTFGQGTVKISPNGRKLGITNFNGTPSLVQLFDFNNATGVVSNSLSLLTGTNCYGCEFSPDGSKFYATSFYPIASIFQWDLCQGSNQNVYNSKTAISYSTMAAFGQIQLAPDNRLYLIRMYAQNLDVLNNPNIAGSGCGYVPNAVSTVSNGAALPNFPANRPGSAAFSHTLSLTTCNTVSFTAANIPTIAAKCGSGPYTVNSISWNFGNPGSGTLNLSTQNNPTHTFSSPGNYLVKLLVYHGGGVDTFYNNVTIPDIPISTVVDPMTCVAAASATASVLGISPTSFSWQPSGQTGQTATLAPGQHTVSILNPSNNCLYSKTVSIETPSPFTPTIVATGSLLCNGLSSGTAACLMPSTIAPVTYSWSSAQNTPTISGLSAGNYSIIVTSLYCSATENFTIIEPSPLISTISPNNPTLCAFDSLFLNASASGGVGSIQYNWNGTVLSNSCIVSHTQVGLYKYSVVFADANGCSGRDSVFVLVLANPFPSVNNFTACIGELINIDLDSTSSYYWEPLNISSHSVTISINGSTVYTVTAFETNGCINSKTLEVTASECLSLKTSFAETNLELFPNPVSKEICIKMNHSCELRIYALDGRLMGTFLLSPGVSSVDIAQYYEGVYLLEMHSDNFVKRSKVLKVAE